MYCLMGIGFGNKQYSISDPYAHAFFMGNQLSDLIALSLM